MKKKACFAVIGILLCVLTSSQAKAQCNIVWWGDESGYAQTDTTSIWRTASVSAAYKAIFGLDPNPDYCGEYHPIIGLYYCQSENGNFGITTGGTSLIPTQTGIAQLIIQNLIVGMLYVLNYV